MMLNRRSLIQGLFVAPAIIRTPGLLMPIKPMIEPYPLNYLVQLNNMRAMTEQEIQAWAAEVVRDWSIYSGVPENYLKGTVSLC